MIFFNSYKKNYFYKGKYLGKRNCLLCFALDNCDEKVIYTSFHYISEIVRGQVFHWFLSLEILSQKSRSSLSPSRTFKYISQEYHGYSFTYLHTARQYHIKTKSGLILVMYPVMQILVHKTNAKIRKILHMKLLWKVRVNENYTLVILLVSNLSLL